MKCLYYIITGIKMIDEIRLNLSFVTALKNLQLKRCHKSVKLFGIVNISIVSVDIFLKTSIIYFV